MHRPQACAMRARLLNALDSIGNTGADAAFDGQE